MTTLKPCPFCGELPVFDTTARRYVVIYCANDACHVRPACDSAPEPVAYERWNTRAAPAAATEEYGAFDPAGLWDRYCEETDAPNRTPQGALAFAVAAMRMELGETRLILEQTERNAARVIAEAVELLRPFTAHYAPWMEDHTPDTWSSTFPLHTFDQLIAARRFVMDHSKS